MNPSTRLARAIVDALVELGVGSVVLCPGSRSAPLAYALAAAAERGRVRLHVRIDERSAGFVALGLARGERAPAAVVTTSGTAVANLHPAVLEASHAGVPLVVVSADRPHALRGTGANQTTDQVRLFGPAARWFGEIPAPGPGPDQEPGWRNVVSRAVAAARGVPAGDPGPVHLNVAFDDPLVPDADDADADADHADARAPRPRTAGLTRVPDPAPPVPGRLPGGGLTVVLAGDGAGPEAAELARSGGWPLLAEPSSGARLSGAIGPYRLLLDVPGLGGAIERVLVCGRPTLSRPVSRLLDRPGVEVVVVSARASWPDPGRRAALVVAALEPGGPAADPRWEASWRAAGAATTAAVDRLLDDEAAAGRLTGPLIAREVAAATGATDVLFSGSSNPVRDLDLAAGPFPSSARVLANRGLAGIDGTLSTASGVALARRPAGGRVRCLVGDLTFLHDAGGLLVGPLEERPEVQIVVVDDGGGGIFGLLEHGQRAGAGPRENALFERVFATPPGAELAALCAGYRVAHEEIGDVETLRKALAEPPPGLSVIQVRLDRAAHRDLAARLRETVTPLA